MREIKLKDRTGRISLFPTYREFVQAAVNGKSELEDSQRSSRSTEASWHGGSWAHAAETGLTGDPQTALALRQGMIREANKILGNVSRLDPVFRADGGTWIDVGRYLSGEPEAWGSMVNMGEQRISRRVAIVFSAGANCFVDTQSYEKAAKAIGGTVLGLKASGASISLYACYRNDRHQDTDILAIDMTPPGGFDITKFAAITKTWFFRRLVFSWWECREKEFRSAHGIYKDGGYGRSVTMTRQDAIEVSGIENALVLNIDQMAGKSQDEIRNTILKCIKDAEQVKIKC